MVLESVLVSYFLNSVFFIADIEILLKFNLSSLFFYEL